MTAVAGVGQNVRVGTTFEQFKRALGNEIARQAIGINVPQAEAERIIGDDALARAYYDNWARTFRPEPAPRPVPVPTPPTPMPVPTLTPTPQPVQHADYPGLPAQYAAAPATFLPPGIAELPPYKMGRAIWALGLGLFGLFLSFNAYFSLASIGGIIFGLIAVVTAAQARPSPNWAIGLWAGIIGAVAGVVGLATAIGTFIAYTSGY